MKLSRWSPWFVLLPILAAGCSDSSTPTGTLAKSLTPAEQRTLNAANEFSFALFRQLAKSQPGVNVFVSPLSASMSLGMALNGASGSTLDAMRTALGVGSADLAEINAAYKGLTDQLRGVDPTAKFELANSIWYQSSFPFKQSFIDTTKKWFNAEVRGFDFADATATLALINGWVRDRTGGKIPTVLDQIAPDDVMFLINAVYFKASWQLKFDPAATKPAPFIGPDGKTQTVSMMYRPMYRSPKFKAVSTMQHAFVELPYGNGAFAMNILMPTQYPSDPKVNLDSVAAALTPATWSRLVDSLKDVEYALALPKFSLTYERKLNDDLTALGMGVAFTDQANFSAMSPAAVALKFVKQKTFVEVNEEGTEAGASTVTGIVPVSLNEIRIDHPFIFAIRERSSGAILFMGKVLRIP